MKKWLCSLLLSVVVAGVFAQSSIDRLINNSSIKNATVGVLVKNMKTGANIVSYNADKSLTTASIMKVITTATALENLGADFRYKTIVGIDRNNPNQILVIGSGDPSLGSPVFPESNNFLKQWAEKCKAVCSAKNDWNVYVADDIFGYDGVSPEWTWIDMANYFAPTISGIAIYDNTLSVYLDTSDGKNAVIKKTSPVVRDLEIIKNLRLNTTGKDNGYFYGMPFSNERILRGDIPSGRSNFVLKGDIPNPGKVLADDFAEALKRVGVNVRNTNTSKDDFQTSKGGNSYVIGKEIFTHTSRPLSDIVKETNVNSNNLFAEHLIRTLGRAQNNNKNSDALTLGTGFVEKFWKQKGVTVDGLTMLDGSGLAPNNVATPQMFCEILTYMYQKSGAKDSFYNSLPKAGSEGTVRNMLKDSKYENKIRMKSGSISGVQCYTGYLMDGDKNYAFAIMVNKFNGDRSKVRKAIESFLLSL